MKVALSHNLARHPLSLRGFTLIEVMIAVAIIGILAAIAYPSYSSYIRQARRADGIAAITTVQLAQEKYRANNSTYTDLTTLGVSTTSPDGYYTISVESVSSTGYTVKATAVTGKSQASDSGCTVISMVVNGASAAPATGNEGCWKK